MVARTGDEDRPIGQSQCWCCGAVDDSARMVALGNHPEVRLCVRCARWAAKQASEIEDRDRRGPGVAVRTWLRRRRGYVLHRGWQHGRLLGAPLRWLGKHLP